MKGREGARVGDGLAGSRCDAEGCVPDYVSPANGSVCIVSGFN